MQLIYPIDIFEDKYNIVRDRFERDSVNLMKNRPLVAKKISIYISLAQCIRKPWKLPLGTTTLKTFVSYTGLWQILEKLGDLEKYRANATCNL